MKQCPICLNYFEPAVLHQVYDRLSCRNKAERQRAQLRDKGALIDREGGTKRATRAEVPGSIVATPERLDEMAAIFLRNPSALPLHWNNVPNDLKWTPPEGVLFNKLAGETAWLMLSTAFLDKPKEVVVAPPRATQETNPFDILDRAFGKTKTNENQNQIQV